MPVFMMIMYILAVLCFLGAAFGASRPRVNLIGLGLAFFAAPALVAAIDAVL